MVARLISSSMLTVMILVLITGCSGGGSTAAEWTGFLLASGDPKVSGNYDFLAPATDYSCSNGSVLSMPDISSTAVVTQDGANISILVNGTDLVFDPLTLVGTVDKYGKIKADATTWYTWTGMGAATGQVLITASIDGQFTPTGWSGTYAPTLTFQDYDVVCSPRRSFKGNLQQ